MWIYLGIISALFLGSYDISKKHAVHQNAVLPVLFLSTIFGSFVICPAIPLSRLFPDAMQNIGFWIPALSLTAHFQIFIKACIVAISWILAYFALKHLPISIITPIRASGPLWTLLGAVFLFGEAPNFMQWVGLIVTLISYYAFSILGRLEGIEFHRNKWIFFIVLATLAGAISSLYDKYLLQNLAISPVAVQAWFSLYLVFIIGVIVICFWFPSRQNSTPFVWRWSIPAIGILLILADFAYFRALSYEHAMVSLLSAIRRSCVIISFIGGGLLFRELNLKSKGWALAGVLAGILLILVGS